MAIELLDNDTINKIAAGEVIERPSSALKELLENSADSKATSVDVEFSNGGKSLLSVKDDGSGMTAKDLPMAVVRHATSKISKFEDLSEIQSFGFRGEALASLGAVSHLEILTSPKDSKEGFLIQCEAGSVSKVKPTAPVGGTIVKVQDLFANTPARLKFLKSDAAETTAIKKTFKQFALAHPELRLRLIQDGEVIYSINPTSLKKRAQHLLDLNDENSLFVESSDGTLKALISDPRTSSATSQDIHFFVQGRPVTDKTLMAAVMESYRHLLMHGQFPKVALFLNLDPQSLDVNVHPTKSQVKFSQPSIIFRLITETLKKGLAELLSPAVDPIEYSPVPVMEQLGMVSEAVTQYNQKSLEPQQITTPPVENKNFSSLQLIGQVNNTYIVTQSRHSLVLVDQHAAHERVLFERIKSQYKAKQVEKQLSLISEVVDLNVDVTEVLCSPHWTQVLSQLGFDISKISPTQISVGSRPALLAESNLEGLFGRLGEKIKDVGDTGPIEDLLGEIWSTMACHGAIRAGKVLSHSEMQSLLVQMDEFSFSSFCPHGRPVSVVFKFTELDKMFKRIV